MGITDRDATSNMTPLIANPVEELTQSQDVKTFSFYQLVELLIALKELNPESREWERECELIFKSDPSLSFAVSDISSLRVLNDEQRIELETTFIGLTGAQSPLPGYLLDHINTEGETGVRRVFLDFFNNHLINLVFRIWRKYRYYIRFQEGASDTLSAQLFSLVGLADPELRGETPINWSKMLSYAGMLAGRSRSPQVVSGIIAHCFDLEDVEIRQWVARRVDIARSQQMKLGQANMTLGENTVLGQYVRECNGKFTLVMKGLSQRRFRDFLPTGKEYLPLCKLVEFVLREQMSYDLELHLAKEYNATFAIGNSHFPQLGWSTFLGDQKQQSITIQVRQ